MFRIPTSSTRSAIMVERWKQGQFVREFLKAHPEYESTRALDALRASEYGRLDAQHHVYLDYTGAALHAESQIRQHAELLNSAVFGNPHSASPTSSGMTRLVEQARQAGPG